LGRRGSGEVDAEKMARERGERQGIENMERKGSGWRLNLGVFPRGLLHHALLLLLLLMLLLMLLLLQVRTLVLNSLLWRRHHPRSCDPHDPLVSMVRHNRGSGHRRRRIVVHVDSGHGLRSLR
jgi:hypothetical protein